MGSAPNSDLVSALVEAGVVDVSSLSRLLSSKRLVVIEDEDQTILRALDKAMGSPLFSSQSSSYVLPAKGVGNFRALAQLGSVISGLAGTKFDMVFIQDRDGLPDFMTADFVDSQKGDGVGVELLERHEIESYLLEPKLIEAAAKKAKRKVTAKNAEEAIFKAADALRAAARMKCRETAKGVNRHLTAKKRKEADLEVQSDEWFDKLNLKSLDVVRAVFPGKELLKESLKILNDGQSPALTMGQLVAALEAEFIADDMKKLLTTAAST
ncbi:MAG: hypothetical protein AMXMBFR34_54610 [Myxococcaceae bacterium]